MSLLESLLEGLDNKPTRERMYNQQEMADMGANYHLHKAFLRYIPIHKLDGLDPRPTNNESDDGEYHKGKPIKHPIETQYDEANDSYMLYDGNHRVAQAKANGQSHILAFVQPENGYYIGKHPKRINPD